MIFGLFSKKKKAAETSVFGSGAQSVGGTSIRYQPDLIDNMKADHVELLAIYTKIKSQAETKSFKKVSKNLKLFRNELEDHLLKENVNLYIYLSHLLKDDTMNSELIAKFRKEMDGIATVALKFLAKYESIGEDKNLHEGFLGELAGIGEVLGGRIKREESTLYTLYTPPF